MKQKICKYCMSQCKISYFIETDVKNSIKSLAHQWIHSCDVFISCLDSHSDGTHLLQRIHWWASDLMLNLSKSAIICKSIILEHIT